MNSKVWVFLMMSLQTGAGIEEPPEVYAEHELTERQQQQQAPQQGDGCSCEDQWFQAVHEQDVSTVQQLLQQQPIDVNMADQVWCSLLQRQLQCFCFLPTALRVLLLYFLFLFAQLRDQYFSGPGAWAVRPSSWQSHLCSVWLVVVLFQQLLASVPQVLREALLPLNATGTTVK